MLKRIALLGAMAALTIVKPSNAVAQGWDGCCGNAGFSFPHCCERPFFPRSIFWSDDRPFFPGPYGRPLYYYGDRFAPWGYNWNAGYTDPRYGYYYPGYGSYYPGYGSYYPGYGSYY
jgi:hypothetical protein